MFKYSAKIICIVALLLLPELGHAQPPTGSITHSRIAGPPLGFQPSATFTIPAGWSVAEVKIEAWIFEARDPSGSKWWYAGWNVWTNSPNSPFNPPSTFTGTASGSSPGKEHRFRLLVTYNTGGGGQTTYYLDESPTWIFQ